MCGTKAPAATLGSLKLAATCGNLADDTAAITFWFYDGGRNTKTKEYRWKPLTCCMKTSLIWGGKEVLPNYDKIRIQPDRTDLKKISAS